VEYVEFKQNNGGVKQPYSECVRNYEEKQKKQKLRRSSMTIKTKSDFGVLLNHTGNNIIENNSFSCNNLIFSSHIADIPSRTVSEVMKYTKLKTLPKKASHRILPKISLSSIQQMASPIIQEPNWFDFIEKSTLPKTMLLPLKSVPVKFNGDLNKTKVIHNYSERMAIAAEGMLMLSTPPSCSNNSFGRIVTPEKRFSKKTFDSI
jgi:hypothetical protein